MKSIFFLLAVFGILFFPSKNNSQIKTFPVNVGVVNAHYDDPGIVLSSLCIKFERIEHKSLENREIFDKFDVIFFPCGIGIYPKTSISIMSRGTKLEGVSLKDDYYKIDDDKAAENIRSFVERGGVAVFFDYSADLLKNAMGLLNYYNDFPNLGLVGQVECVPSGEYASFLVSEKQYLNFNHVGWNIIKSIESGEVLLSGKCNTPLGEKKTIIASMSSYKKGLVIYSAYHENSISNELIRFIVIRGIENYYIKKNQRYIKAWDLKPEASVVDFSAADIVRDYRLSLSGRGTLFAFFPSGKWRVEVFDSNHTLLYDGHRESGVFRLDIKREDLGNLFVRVYSLNHGDRLMYSLWTASGFRLFPYYREIFVFVLVLFFLIIYAKFIRKEPNSTSSMLKNEVEEIQ